MGTIVFAMLIFLFAIIISYIIIRYDDEIEKYFYNAGDKWFEFCKKGKKRITKK